MCPLIHIRRVTQSTSDVRRGTHDLDPSIQIHLPRGRGPKPPPLHLNLFLPRLKRTATMPNPRAGQSRKQRTKLHPPWKLSTGQPIAARQDRGTATSTRPSAMPPPISLSGTMFAELMSARVGTHATSRPCWTTTIGGRYRAGVVHRPTTVADPVLTGRVGAASIKATPSRSGMLCGRSTKTVI